MGKARMVCIDKRACRNAVNNVGVNWILLAFYFFFILFGTISYTALCILCKISGYLNI